MKKPYLAFLMAILIILSTAVPVLAAESSSQEPSVEMNNPVKGQEAPELNLTPEQQAQKDALINELKKSKELTRSKYQEVNTLRNEIHVKLDSLSKEGKELSTDKNAKVQQHLTNIKTIQEEMQQERIQLKEQRKSAEKGKADFDTMVKALETINALEKRNQERLDKILNELNEIKKLIG